MKEAQYENRIVIFIDILGFKQVVEDSVKDEDNSITKIKNALTYIKRVMGSKVNNFESLHVTQFSDSVFISFLCEDVGCSLTMLERICYLQRDLLKRGFLCRGGISYGKAVHTESYLFGPAVNKAYRIESDMAIFPRVVVDVDAFEPLHAFPDDVFQDYENVYSKTIDRKLPKDTDGQYYVDYLRIKENDEGFTMALKKCITEGLKQFHGCEIVNKYEWLKDKYNQSLRRYKSIIPIAGVELSDSDDLLNIGWIKALKVIE